ncbi:hypothetical protein, partial [Streptomyces lunaelactis]
MTTPDFRPTHVVPRDGLPAWEAPDVSRPTAPLDALLPVQVVDRRGDWGQIVCANGWSAWVDGRLLVSVPQEPPVAGQPAARTADPRPLLARVEESLGRYRRAAEELTAGRGDGETFRRRTQGLRVGMVVDGESVWLYDAEHERWVYCDGVRLSTYAAGSGPGGASGAGGAADGPVAGREPTRVVSEEPSGMSSPSQGPPSGPEPTRVVGPERGSGDGPAGRADDRATGLVGPDRAHGGAPGPTGAPHGPAGSGPGRLVQPAADAPYSP